MKDQLNILLVEDDEEDYFLIEDLLHVNYEKRVSVTWANSFCSMKQIANLEQFDAFLIDYYLGDSTGIDVITYLSNQVKKKSPFILLTGKNLADFQEEFPEADATDFLRKTFLTSDALDRSIKNAIVKTVYQNELEDLRRKLHAIKTHETVSQNLESAFTNFALPFQRMCDQLLALLQNSDCSPVLREHVLESINSSTYALNQFYHQFKIMQGSEEQTAAKCCDNSKLN